MIKFRVELIIILLLLVMTSTPIINNFSKASPIYKKTIYAFKDTFISEYSSTTNFGNYKYLLLGVYSGKQRRILLYFSISSIPHNAIIVSAKLVLTKYSHAYFSASYKFFYVKMVSKYWSESYATWEKRTNYYSWTNPGGDYYSTPYSYFKVYKNDPTVKTYEIDVTNLVKEWHSGSKSNYGFIIYPGGTAEGIIWFRSSEYDNQDERPKLIIEYKLPSIVISATPSTKTVAQGQTVTYQISVTASDYSGTVQLSLSGLPSGAMYSFNPAQGTPPFNSILTIATSSSTPTGTYTITIKGTGTDVSNQTTVKLKVVKPAAFTLSLTPSTLSIKQGKSGTTTIKVNPVLGYNKKVTISVINAPSGVTVTFSTNPVTPGGSTTATIHVSSSATPGTYPVIFSGVGEDGKQATTTLTLTIIEVPFDFTVEVSPKTITVDEGEDAIVTIQVNLVSGQAKPVTLTVTGLPSGATYSLSTTTVTPPGSSILTIKTTGLKGNYTITVKGKYGSIEKTDTFKLKVEAFDFEITVNPKNIEINQGESASVIITVTLKSGTAKEVSLFVQGMPSGATYTINPTKVKPTGTAVLTINAGSAKGTFNIIVKGTYKGVEKTDTFTLTIKEKKCFIATATYGSEVSNEVNLLRSFRDNIVLSTYAGQRFYVAFNAFYYSWSPYVAKVILENPWLKPPMRILLYPLIGSLLVATTIATPLTTINSELAVYIAGTIASSLLSIVYVTPLNLIINRIVKRRLFTRKGALKLAYITAGVLLASIIAQIMALDMVLTLATATYVIMLIITTSYALTVKILDIVSTAKQKKMN